MATAWCNCKTLLALAIVPYVLSELVTITPVEQVIKLMTDMKTEAEAEGENEAKTYETFTCFCKDKSMSISASIMKGKDDCHEHAAGFEEKSADITEKQDALKEEITRKVNLETEKKDRELQLVQDTAAYEATEADLTKAISLLERAIKTLKSSKPTESLFAIGQSVKKSLALAEALKLVEAGPRWTSFLQDVSGVDPADPQYKFHSQGIITVLEKLLEDFKNKKSTADSDWATTKKSHEDAIAKLGNELDLNAKVRDSLKVEIDTMISEAAALRGKLVKATSQLQDDEAYLKELTEMCESRAKDWDQRTTMRAGELEALNKAIEIMTDKVKDNDKIANKRALLLLQHQAQSVPAQQRANKSLTLSHAVRMTANESKITLLRSNRSTVNSTHNKSSGAKAMYFFQSSLVRSHAQDSSHLALEALRQESNRIHSVALSALVMRIAADPFAKVKTLIQNLIERLIEEATQEATKKGFCDKALADAEQERDFRYAAVKKLSATLQTLEAEKGALELEIDDLTDSIASLDTASKEATENRAAEKKDNLKSMQAAKDGLKAVTEAMNILKDFYRQAARARVLLQATPLQADTKGAGFSGAYKGNQAGSKGIIGLLEVIKSDFERTIKTTSQSEEKSAAEQAKFLQSTTADITSKTTKKECDVEDLAKTDNTIASKKEDMQTNMDLMDEALKALQKHQSMCVNHGQTYADRKAKREEELAALKKALSFK